MSSSGSKLRLLRQRRDYLARRRAEMPESHPGRPHVAGELAALEWALPVLEDMVKRDRDLAMNPHRARREYAWSRSAYVALRRLYELDPEAAAGVLTSCRHDGVRAALAGELARGCPDTPTGELRASAASASAEAV